MKNIVLLFISTIFTLFLVNSLQAQDNLGNHSATQNLDMNGYEIDDIKYLDIRTGAGNGIRFRSNPNYEISMGNTSAYHYGPVNVESVKFNMPKFAGKGWIWGSVFSPSVAALTADGTMQLEKNLYALGKIGIGTTSPSYKLDVCGTIRAKEVRVETGWCDYVFEDDYVLRSLKDVEVFIEKNKHLPDVPAGVDIENNGLALAAMQATHMLKIEELTLYIIEMNKQMEALQSEVQDLKNAK